MNQFNNEKFTSKYTEEDKKWIEKSIRKAKKVNREIKKILKNNINNIDLEKGRFFVEHEADCGGGSCCEDDCNKCNQFYITDIEVDAIVDLGIMVNNKYVELMIISESKRMPYLDAKKYDDVKFNQHFQEFYYKNGKLLKEKDAMSVTYYNNFSLILMEQDNCKRLYDNENISLEEAMKEIVNIIKNIK